MPTPRKDSVASVSTAAARLMVAMTSTGLMTLGRMWRSMIRRGRQADHLRRLHIILRRSRPWSRRAPCGHIAPIRGSRWRRSGSNGAHCARCRPRGRRARAMPLTRSASRMVGRLRMTSPMRMISGVDPAAEIAGEQAEHDADATPRRAPRRRRWRSRRARRRGWPTAGRGPGCRCRAGSAVRRSAMKAGGISAFIRSKLAMSVGSYGRDPGASSAAATMTATRERAPASEHATAAARRAARRRARWRGDGLAHARLVRRRGSTPRRAGRPRDVDDDEEEADEEQIGRHHGDVDEAHRLDEQQAHAGPLEHRLGDDREGDQRADLQARHGDRPASARCAGRAGNGCSASAGPRARAKRM